MADKDSKLLKWLWKNPKGDQGKTKFQKKDLNVDHRWISVHGIEQEEIRLHPIFHVTQLNRELAFSVHVWILQMVFTAPWMAQWARYRWYLHGGQLYTRGRSSLTAGRAVVAHSYNAATNMSPQTAHASHSLSVIHPAAVLFIHLAGRHW